jgi:hypothetical protein
LSAAFAEPRRNFLQAVIAMNLHIDIAMQYPTRPTGFGVVAWPRANNRSGKDVMQTSD